MNESTIEAFGLKIPRDEIAFWGAVTLCALQLYFWLHLHEITGRIGPKDEGWDVAWIGVYRSRISLVITLMSTSVLPLAAVVLLGINFWLSQRSRHPLVAEISPVLFALIVALLCTITAERLVRLRSARPSDLDSGTRHHAESER